MLRPWTLKVVLNRDGTQQIYLQLAHALIEEIRSGRLLPGTALPGTRELGDMVGVNRKTVVQSYDELCAQGWLIAEPARGTFVSSQLPAVDLKESRSFGTVLPDAPDFRMRRPAPDLPSWQKLPADTLSFDDGLPDPRLVPADALGRAWRQALVSSARLNRLGYGDPRGLPVLRQAVADMLRADRAVPCTPDHICIVRGSQMGIYLAARLLVVGGDTVAMESLSYPPAREAFRAAGADIAAVGLDEHGMRLDELEALCRRRRVRAVYVTPHHQFPTTVVLRPERRLHLLALAEQFGFAIVEDDYDHEFHFARRPMLPLISADRWGKVVYIGSVSKLLSPAMRIGYIAAPTGLIDRAAMEVMTIDRQGDPITEQVVAEMMQNGTLRSHTRKALQAYAERRRVFADALVAGMDGRIAFDIPDGGLALWVRFADDIDPDQLAEAARGRRVSFVPGGAYATFPTAVRAARLGFGSLNNAELALAVRRLGAAMGEL
jgi:GntR family transcriptional regulator / MocR family aminotransferase